MNLAFNKFENSIADRIRSECEKHPDPSHDFLHVQRVVNMARNLGITEGANLDVVLPAAYLHDVVVISKSDPRRSMASQLSADEAVRFLESLAYPKDLLPGIHHAIVCHSFSANKKPETIEAKVVQDADRLDGIGAIGIARCFALAGVFKTKFYNEQDLTGESRKLDDSQFTLDHFFIKLLTVYEKLQTPSGRFEGEIRTSYLKNFVMQLKSEIASTNALR